MKCPACSTEYDAVNQHSVCPECRRKVGTASDDEDQATLTKVIAWFEDWETATEEARKDAERDHDYYDGIQWTADEISDLKSRGQPPIVKNRIFKKINFLLGQEVRNRADPKALPRSPAHDDDVRAVTDALRYVCDAEDFDATSSACWFDVVTKGYGGAVVEHEKIGEEIEVKIRHVKWDRLWFDLHSRKADFSDALHFGISTWYDVDDAVDFYAKRQDAVDNAKDIIEAGFGSHGSSPLDETHEDRPKGQWTSAAGNRKRVLVSECYYRDGKDWYVCHYTKAGFVVKPRKTGYLDEAGNSCCALVVNSAFVTRDGDRYGLIRHMIGPQDEINKRSSKALHWLSVDRVISEDGAVLDPDEAQTERAKPDGWIRVERGALQNGRIQFEKGIDMAQGQVQLLAEAKQEIDSIGPEVPQIGSLPNAASGRALMMRQQIGSLELAPLEDGHKRWKRNIYRQIWYRVRQFWASEKWLRVTDDADRTGYRFVGLNRQMTRGQRFSELLSKEVPVESALAAVLGPQSQLVMQQAQQQSQSMAQQSPQQTQMPPEQQQAQLTQMLMRHPRMADPMIAGDVAELDVDIVLDESPDVSVLQQEEYEKLVELIPSFLQAQQSPQLLLEMALEASQLRSKKRLLEMLKKPPDPQAMQLQQAMQQLGAEQAKASVAHTQAQTQAATSQAQLNQAKAQQAGAEAQTTAPLAQAEIEAKKAGAMHDAATAGMRAGGG